MYIVEIQNQSGQWERRSQFETSYPLTAICDCGKHMAQCLKRAVRVLYVTPNEERIISEFEQFVPRPGHYRGWEEE